MERLKKIGRFLCSMKCAVILLLILAAACTAGSLIPQGESLTYYTAAYSETAAGAVLLFGLDDVFHCWWFVGLTLFLCVNLLFCNIIRFPALFRRMREGFTITRRLAEWDNTPAAVVEEEPEEIFHKLGFRIVRRGKAAQAAGMNSGAVTDSAAVGTQPVTDIFETRYAVRNRFGIWGAWLCHVGMLVIIAGFGLGQMFQTSYTVYGVPGQTKAIGDTGYGLRIDDFRIKLREDETVEQYETDMTVMRQDEGRDSGQPDGPGAGDTGGAAASLSGTASVNHPLTLHGMKFYQNSTGWAADVEVWKGQEKLQEGTLCAGEYALIEDMEGLAVVFNAFYPDYVKGADGMPMTASSALKNPGYLYTIYYHDQVVGMNVLTGGDMITVEDYGIIFKNPQPYTLIQVKRDPFTWLAALGGLLVMISLILAFYLTPEEVWAVRQSDGRWALAGKSKKSGAYFLEELAKMGKQEKKE